MLDTDALLKHVWIEKKGKDFSNIFCNFAFAHIKLNKDHAAFKYTWRFQWILNKDKSMCYCGTSQNRTPFEKRINPYKLLQGLTLPISPLDCNENTAACTINHATSSPSKKKQQHNTTAWRIGGTIHSYFKRTPYRWWNHFIVHYDNSYIIELPTTIFFHHNANCNSF